MALNGMTEQKPRLMVIVSSVREGRVGGAVGRWVEQLAREHGGFADVDVADLAEIDLPLMTEPNHPRLRQYTQPTTWAWSERVEAADAVVIVTPEYNHGLPAPLVNALDYLLHEWSYKAAGLVGYGGASGGMRALQQLKTKLLALDMHPVKQAVNIPFVASQAEDDVFTPTEGQVEFGNGMLDAVLEWDRALRTLRQPVGSAAD